MSTADLDASLSRSVSALRAFFGLFEREDQPVQIAARAIIPAMLHRGERLYRRHARQQLKKLEVGEARAVRIAATASGTVEIVLHVQMWKHPDRTPRVVPAGLLAVTLQQNPNDRKWDIKPEHLATLAHNLDKRRRLVPDRAAFEALYIEKQEDAA